jgi:Pre-mRNA 3'-end-processing endonuclease polyadenylation factor C-term
VEWEASPAGDIVADALIALIMHAQSSAASIRLTSKPCRHPRAGDSGASNGDEEPALKKSRPEEESLTQNRLRLIKDTLKDQFDTIETVYEGNTASYEIKTDTGLDSGVAKEDGYLLCNVKVSFADEYGGAAEISVECEDHKIASNIKECLKNLARTFIPLESQL